LNQEAAGTARVVVFARRFAGPPSRLSRRYSQDDRVEMRIFLMTELRSERWWSFNKRLGRDVNACSEQQQACGIRGSVAATNLFRAVLDLALSQKEWQGWGGGRGRGGTRLGHAGIQIKARQWQGSKLYRPWQGETKSFDWCSPGPTLAFPACSPV
jgi:hypothetical protein